MLISVSLAVLWAGLCINASVHNESNLALAYFCLVVSNLHIMTLKMRTNGDTN